MHSICLLATKYWSAVRLTVGSFRVVAGCHGDRHAPIGMRADSIDWVCVPPTYLDRWAPSPEEVAAVLKEEVKAGVEDMKLSMGAKSAGKTMNPTLSPTNFSA